MDVLGVDAIPALIAQARSMSTDRFELATYTEITAGKLAEKFDIVVANFSLFGNESVVDLFRWRSLSERESIPLLLNPQGALIIQTLHPTISSGDLAYVDGWRSSSWAGFSDDFTDPAPWYFRTLATWVKLYRTSGFTLVEIREPLDPSTGKPASVIFVGVKYE